MERNNHPNQSPTRCTKIREALSNSSAVKAMHRISHYHHQQPSGSPVPQPRHLRGDYNGEGNGVIPIKFIDHPKPNSKGQAHQVGKVGTRFEPERPRYASVRGEERGKSTGQEFEHQHEKKDMNYAFGEFIQRAREKLRTVSNIGRAHQSKPAQDETGLNVAKKKNTHKDQISEWYRNRKKHSYWSKTQDFFKFKSAFLHC